LKIVRVSGASEFSVVANDRKLATGKQVRGERRRTVLSFKGSFCRYRKRQEPNDPAFICIREGFIF
jgi:hypothetical protein